MTAPLISLLAAGSLAAASVAAASLVAGSVAATGSPQPADSGPRRPHVVVILVDDLGWADLGCYGSAFHETPNLDRLAATGMRFTDAYASSPVCSPTRASLLTGKHPARVGITDWIPGDDPVDRKLRGPKDSHALPLEEVTLAEALKDAGYRTFFAGKWHLGSAGYFPEDQGFDINKGGHHVGSPPGGYYAPYKNPKLEDGPEGEYLTDRLTDETIRFVREHAKAHPDSPFLAFLAFYTVHTPIQACRRHLARFEAKAEGLPQTGAPAFVKERDGWTKERQDLASYASMVHAMDENVGRLLAELEALGLSERTIVLFTSDNGGLSTLRRQGAPTSNRPLRAGKGWCYEGGIRVPLLVRAPGVTQPGSVCGVPVTSVDLYPTVLELAGLPLRPERHVDGASLVPLLEGSGSSPGRSGPVGERAEALERRALFWHYPHYHGSAWTPGAAVRSGDWKLVELYEEETSELYDLGADIGETRDLSEAHPEKHRELLDLLHRWQEEVGARMPSPQAPTEETLLFGGCGGVYLLAEPGELTVEIVKRDRNVRGRRHVEHGGGSGVRGRSRRLLPAARTDTIGFDRLRSTSIDARRVVSSEARAQGRG